ncbi:MAG TPA: thioredoxin domain-containing protein [Gemmatimonadaceae bacterium]|jgi:protein-disulfide isomerase|nr:thioredoxin domain-containing protein [Gemmatimonadaceae bacterium]
MLHRRFPRLARLTAAAALFSAACSTRSDSPPPAAAAQRVVTSTGDVALGATTSGLSDSVSTSADKARIRGAETAPVWLVEISDFQCPFCKQWHDQVFATIDREYVKTGKVRLAYLNFPLSRIHPNAQAAAEAAMCAGVQGKFWELHESLFISQPRWADQKSPAAIFDSLARAAGVEPKGWSHCMTTHATAKLIEADRDRSTKAGVESTPTFFVGDRALAGAYPVDSFRVIIDQAIAKAKAPR